MVKIKEQFKKLRKNPHFKKVKKLRKNPYFKMGFKIGGLLRRVVPIISIITGFVGLGLEFLDVPEASTLGDGDNLGEVGTSPELVPSSDDSMEEAINLDPSIEANPVIPAIEATPSPSSPTK